MGHGIIQINDKELDSQGQAFRDCFWNPSKESSPLQWNERPSSADSPCLGLASLTGLCLAVWSCSLRSSQQCQSDLPLCLLAAMSQATVPCTLLQPPLLALVLALVLLPLSPGPFLAVLSAQNGSPFLHSSGTNSSSKLNPPGIFLKTSSILICSHGGLGFSFRVLITVDDLWFISFCDYLMTLSPDFNQLEGGDNLSFVHYCIFSGRDSINID